LVTYFCWAGSRTMPVKLYQACEKMFCYAVSRGGERRRGSYKSNSAQKPFPHHIPFITNE
jgi:hypothetical protein